MTTSTDIIVAEPDSFDAILADVRNAMELDTTPDGGATIDDVVSIISIHRNAINDRAARWKIRRGVYARFASHETISTRTLAALPVAVRDELANFSGQDIESVASTWMQLDDSTPTDLDAAVRTLKQLVGVCKRAKNSQLCVLLRTNQPPNAFEIAFQKAAGKRLENFQRAFTSWDESKKYEAHQRYNYYLKQGLTECLNRVLRDFTRPKTSRVNLKTDQRKIQRYICKRVEDYVKSLSPDLGDGSDPLKMISLLFDVEYQGFVDLIFDTRPDAAEEFEFVEGTEHCCELDHWHEGVERFSCENLALRITLQDGAKVTIEPNSDGDEFDNYIGDMLRDTIIAMREEGAFSKLPIADHCVFCVGGSHTGYFWRSDDQITQD
jgi:hypothetical protein